MKNIISIGALVATVALTGCSADTEHCGNMDHQGSEGKQALALLTTFTKQNVTKICVSRNGVEEGKFDAITEDGKTLHVKIMLDNTLRVTDINNGSVTTIMDNKNGTYTVTNNPLIATDKVEISKK